MNFVEAKKELIEKLSEGRKVQITLSVGGVSVDLQLTEVYFDTITDSMVLYQEDDRIYIKIEDIVNVSYSIDDEDEFFYIDLVNGSVVINLM